MKGFPDLPPLWWLGSVLVIWALAVALPGLHGQGLPFISRVLTAAALVLIGWSGVWFWRKKTPIEPHHQPKSLVREGPYRLSRNPIYLALVVLTLGSAAWHGSWLGVAIAVALAWVLDRRFVRPEEDGLRAVFGAEAEAYFQQTRRWL